MMKCFKCDSISTIVLRKKDHYCDNCFLTSTNHKFRACIGKNKILSKNDKVLLSLSGGTGSTVLLDLVHHGISLDVHKKLRIIPYVIHFIEGDDCTAAKALKTTCETYNIEAYFVHISDYMQQDSKLPAVFTLPEENNEMDVQFQSILKGMPVSAYNDFINKAKKTLFIKYAKLLECKYVFTAETTSTLAINLLSNLSIGRGSQVENDIGFMDCRDETVTILRPMKDISIEELDYYIKIKKLTPSQAAERDGRNSLQKTITGFVTALQENFQSTISAVCRTAEKIGVADSGNNNKCAICKSPFTKMNHKLSALDATIFSRTISHGKLPKESGDTDETLFPHINKYLCYSCSRNYSEMNNASPHLQNIMRT